MIKTEPTSTNDGLNDEGDDNYDDDDADADADVDIDPTTTVELETEAAADREDHDVQFNNVNSTNAKTEHGAGINSTMVSSLSTTTTTTTTTTSFQQLIKIDMSTLPIPSRAPELYYSSSNNLGGGGGNESSRVYWDRSHYDSPESQLRALATSSTLYVGNVNFSTRVSHIRSHFSMIGYVKDIVMGIDRFKKTPCGFCFVQYDNRCHALAARSLLSGTKLDGKIIRVELDAGFQNGRQYGRGQHGGQVRDFRKQRSIGQQQQNQNQNQYRSGDKRSRYGSDSTNENRRPRIEDALPTGRIRVGNTGSDDGTGGYYGPDSTAGGAAAAAIGGDGLEGGDSNNGGQAPTREFGVKGEDGTGTGLDGGINNNNDDIDDSGNGGDRYDDDAPQAKRQRT